MSGRLVLATDLDGTMAHGGAAARERLVALLREDFDARLVYVTGRTPETTRELARRTGLPRPDVLIADVGTSVLEGLGPGRIDSIEAELERSWPGGEIVRERLARLGAELAEQELRAPRRVSYWIEAVRRMRDRTAPDDDVFAARMPGDPSLGEAATRTARDVATRAAGVLHDLTVDVLVSANVYLDVLPRGVDKGTTLQRVLRWLDASGDDCIVAGDSLNDLALFRTGMRGIVVANCEPALREHVRSMAHVYLTRAEGVAGVLEGVLHHNAARRSS